MTTLSPHQEEALRTVVSRIKGLITPEPVTYLGGYAGTGKSTLLPFILEATGIKPEHVWFCAPTGKAAKVMRGKLKAQQYPNSHATTIHSAIYRANPPPIATLERDVMDHEVKLMELTEQLQVEIPEGLNLNTFPEVVKLRKDIARLKEELSSAYREDKLNFNINVDSAIAMSRLIVVDEASMVGKQMTFDLMYFGVPILAMGDPGQLPPVGDEPGLTAGLPNFFLKEIHRQAQDNPIIHLSMLAREGKDLPYGKYGEEAEVLERSKFQEIYTDLATRPQFLCGTNKTRWKVNQYLRQDFGFVNKAGDRVGPRAGEPLVVKKNTKDYPNLVNGTSCVAVSSADIPEGNARLQLSFEDDEGTEYRDKPIYQGLFEEHFSKRRNGFTAPESIAFSAKKNCISMDWEYGVTVHTSQGSQYDNVVLIDESSCFKQDADRHLYTGVTRAAKTIKILR